MAAPIPLGAVALDCPDPPALARFYATMLGAEIAYESDDFCAVQLDHLWLTTHRIADHRPPDWPDGDVAKQVHLDLAVEDLDRSEEAALAAGATKAATQPGPERWRVMLDPAGHPFCLTTQIPG
jgi:catechol 2,3-dioxygenase-like lactoylglutathione lyase family enzyme